MSGPSNRRAAAGGTRYSMSNRDFSDHVVVVTGASGGLGAAAAEEVAHVLCDAALSGRGDVYAQPNAFARVREYVEKQPG